MSLSIYILLVQVEFYQVLGITPSVTYHCTGVLTEKMDTRRVGF